MDSIDKALINQYQSGFPLTAQPYADIGEVLGIGEDEVIQRLQHLLDSGVLTRFGPLFDVERFGGQFTLAAMQVAPDELDRVAEQVNGFPEVAHNYERDHRLNLWFVIACERADETAGVIERLESVTGHTVYAFPKEREFFIGLRFEA